MKKIFILEDEDALGMIYKKKLESAKFKVDWFKTSADILKAADGGDADLVFLDHGLKGEEVTGTDIAPKLKKSIPKAKFVILSNFNKMYLEKEAIKAGVDDCLVKIDTSPADLVAYAKKLLG